MVISVQRSQVLVFTEDFLDPHEGLCGGSPLQLGAQFDYLGVAVSAGSGMDPPLGSCTRTCGPHGPFCSASMVSCTAMHLSGCFTAVIIFSRLG